MFLVYRAMGIALLSLSSLAHSQCGIVSLKISNEEGVGLWLESIDNAKKASYDMTVRGNYIDIKLPTGRFSLNLVSMPAKDVKYISRRLLNSVKEERNVFAEKRVTPKNRLRINVGVEANRRHIISLEGGQDAIDVSEKSLEMTCVKRRELLHYKKTDKETVDVKLTPILQRRLGKFMQSYAISGEVSNTMPVMFRPGLGLKFQNYRDQLSAGLVLAVTPNSIARKMGVLAGDEIIAFNSITIDSEKPIRPQIDAILVGLKYGDDIYLDIERDSKKVSLEGNYLPRLTPNTLFTVDSNQLPNLIEHRKMSDELTIDYEILMSDINQFMVATNPEASSYRVVGEKITDPSFGVRISPVEFKEGYAFDVLAIESHSTAEKLGLLVGDRVISINSNSFSDPQLKDVSLVIGTLKPEQNIEIEIIRNGKRQILKQTFRPSVLPEFTLIVDVNGLQSAQELLSKSLNQASDWLNSEDDYYFRNFHYDIDLFDRYPKEIRSSNTYNDKRTYTRDQKNGN